MRKNSYLTVTDQFCGAGGSSQGVRKVAKRINGLEVKLAMNHWKLAIETHNTNFPETLHDCTDVSACDPRRYPSTDILITSPECTNHSLAKGAKSVKAQMDMFAKGKLDPAAERSRATMWDVCRFTEYHKYNVIIVENVVDARKWVMFDSWIMAMMAMGYKHKCKYINSMHCHPTPQSRDRMYVVFWKKGNKEPDLNFTPKAHCPKCASDVEAIQCWKPNRNSGKYNRQYVFNCPVHNIQVEPYFYAAANIIDWTDYGQRIGDRKKPLSPNTIKRIQHGLDKYKDKPLVVTTRYSSGVDFRVRNALESNIPTQPGDQSHGVAFPFLFHKLYGKEARGIVRPLTKAAYTQTTLEHQAVAMPFIFKGEHTMKQGYTKSVEETLQTQATRQTMGLVVPFILENYRTGLLKPINEPIGSQTTSGAHHSFIQYYYNGNEISHINDSVNTVTTKDRMSLVNCAPKIEDCHYRMLKPSEIQGAMAFDPDYIVLGTGKQKVKQLGNAVTPPVMEWLVERCVQSLN